MRTEELWQQMEAEGGTVGWSTRLARPEPACRLLVAIDRAAGARALLLRAGASAIPPRREWPESRGLELLVVAHGGDTYLCVRLRDATSKDVFAALADVLALRVTAIGPESEAVSELLDALRRWQAFLAAARDGLGMEAQRGLYGELHLLDRVLVPALGPRAAVQGWKGFAAAHQDYQFAGASIEVKTTAAASPTSVRITSERQLDTTGAGDLYLHVLAVDERETTPSPAVASESLAGLVSSCRAAMGTDVIALAKLNDGLLQAGWLDAHAARHDVRRIAVRTQLFFQVRDGFPRLLARDLPVGLTDVSYALDLAACRPFAVQIATILASLARGVTPPFTPVANEA